jgi:hypothetical protein
MCILKVNKEEKNGKMMTVVGAQARMSVVFLFPNPSK